MARCARRACEPAGGRIPRGARAWWCRERIEGTPQHAATAVLRRLGAVSRLRARAGSRAAPAAAAQRRSPGRRLRCAPRARWCTSSASGRVLAVAESTAGAGLDAIERDVRALAGTQRRCRHAHHPLGRGRRSGAIPGARGARQGLRARRGRLSGKPVASLGRERRQRRGGFCGRGSVRSGCAPPIPPRSQRWRSGRASPSSVPPPSAWCASAGGTSRRGPSPARARAAADRRTTCARCPSSPPIPRSAPSTSCSSILSATTSGACASPAVYGSMS